MGRLSLAIGRQKEGSDGRSKSRHLRSSIKGFLGIPGAERASVDLGDIDYSSLDDGASQTSARNSHYRGHYLLQPQTAAEAKITPVSSALARAESGFVDSQAAPAAAHERRALRSNNSSQIPLRAAASMTAGGAPVHAHAEIAAGQLERNSVSVDRDAASDAEKSGWRRRGSLISSRLAVPLRKDASSSSSVNSSAGGVGGSSRVLIRKESTPQFSALPSLPRPASQLPPHPELGDQTKSPFWRGSSTLRIAGSPALTSEAEAASQQERTHRSSSVPFLTPIPTGAGAHPQITSASSSKPAASPYLRAVSSGLGGSSVRRTAKGYASTHQDRFPNLVLDNSTPPGSPTAAAGDATPMTFLVSPRARASSSAKHMANHSLSSTPSRDLNLCKRTLSSATIPSLELNAPASPRAMSGAVDMSEFGVVVAATGSAGPSSISERTPTEAVASRLGKSTGAAADRVHETHHMEVQHDPRTGRKMINQYMIIRELGRGTHGKVKLAFDTISGEYYAIKVIDKESHGRARRMRPAATAHRSHQRSHGFLRIDLDKMEKVKREVAILKKCRHPNVVRLREVIDDAHARRIYLVIEYMDGGEIAWRDASGLPVMAADKARSVFRDLVLGVEYLHYVGILHRDLKPQNLLCNRAGTVKISDFGVSFLSRQTRTPPPDADRSQFADDVHTTPSSQPLGRPAAIANAHLHHCASQPLMGGPTQPRPIDGPGLHRKASALSRGSGKPASRSGLESSSLRIRPPQARPALHAQPSGQLQRHISQSARRQATMGMTDEFGNRKPSGSPPGGGASGPDEPPGPKLPAEFMSADLSVYDPFDSSDSDEFFSSSDNASDYGSQVEPGIERLKVASDDDDDDNGGIVFGVLPSPSKTTDSPSRPRHGHRRKGTLGEIEFQYDEKDEERELAKTAGTPAFFAPELCCTAEELAKVLGEQERARRQARCRLEPQRNAVLPPGVDSESEGGGSGGGAARPASLFIESLPLGGDSPRGPSKVTKRHSALTSLLSRPFSSKGRPATRNSSQSSIRAQATRPDDADASSDDEPDQPLPANLITPAIDIWAMGVTLYCLIYGRVPFQATTEFELFNVIPRRPLEFPQHLEVPEDDDDDDVPPLFGMPDFGHNDSALDAPEQKKRPVRQISLPPLDPDLRDLLTRLLDKDFRTRITIDEIKRHPWVVKDLEQPVAWAAETDPKSHPSVTITSQEVEHAMVPKVRQRRGFRATVKQRISMLAPLAGKGPRSAAPHQQMRLGGAKTKSSLDWLKIWQ
ncbi:hypothetical protein H4S02_000434 [Coemansia sp. RSA 2611]|nr:hypothetical protein H4S02_000434 [Coemansia sp. RSA 2611]